MKKNVKIYFKGGSGIENPIDFNGNEIKIGDILTHCYFDNYPNFFEKEFPQMTQEEMHRIAHKPSYIVKWNEEGFFFGEGIEESSLTKSRMYLHDFRFKFTKIIK